MKTYLYADSQIISILKQTEAGTPLPKHMPAGKLDHWYAARPARKVFSCPVMRMLHNPPRRPDQKRLVKRHDQ